MSTKSGHNKGHTEKRKNVEKVVSSFYILIDKECKDSNIKFFDYCLEVIKLPYIHDMLYCLLYPLDSKTKSVIEKIFVDGKYPILNKFKNFKNFKSEVIGIDPSLEKLMSEYGKMNYVTFFKIKNTKEFQTDKLKVLFKKFRKEINYKSPSKDADDIIKKWKLDKQTKISSSITFEQLKKYHEEKKQHHMSKDP
ncbi:hypothetical protein QTN25_010057 [Entamoeba marina]